MQQDDKKEESLLPQQQNGETRNTEESKQRSVEGERVEVDGSLKSCKDPSSAVGEDPALPAPSLLGKRTSSGSQLIQPTDFVYGQALQVTSSGGSFPAVGSVLGPFFCLEVLGKGTFSSVHKCINMQYFHHQKSQQQQQQPSEIRRVAAAKVEHTDFQQSGVLQTEATTLDFLHRSAPSGTVPVYMGNYKSDKFAAILMEFLPGQDMNQLREQVVRAQTNPVTRRIALQDAVYLCGEVMLPLLQRMHHVGIVHRDVKPSNCVRSGSSDGNVSLNSCRDFCLVDFGLSKSIVVPETSSLADKEHPWPADREWLRPLNYKGKATYRKERSKADFRGTSIYASLRVHQERDYSPRDDIWSLMYVFCDLVSGGLPWMSHALNRDRQACFRLKERLHGDFNSEDGTADHTADLLKGDAHCVNLYRREKQEEAGVDPEKLITVPEPLEMSKDTEKVNLLRKAFKHLAKLEFYDLPDYALIQECIRGFLKGEPSKDPLIQPIDWAGMDEKMMMSPEVKKSGRTLVPQWDLVDNQDPLEDGIFDAAEEAAKEQHRPDDFLSRLPVEMRFHLAQLDCNLAAQKSGTLPPHRALRDWMQIVLPLLYEEWDARRYEDGGHRTSTDGFRRQRLLELLRKCDSYASEFGNFASREYYYEATSENGGSEPSGSSARKKRKIDVKHPNQDQSKSSDLLFVSRALFGLKRAIKAETMKKSAPPMRISFS